MNRKHHSQTQDSFNKSISRKKTSTNSYPNANLLSSYSTLPFHFTNKRIEESVRFIPPKLMINHQTMFFNMIADPTPHNINSHHQHKKQLLKKNFLTDFKAKKLQNSTTSQNIFDMMREANRNRYGFVADESLLNLSQNDFVNNESYSFNKKVEKDMKDDNTLFEKEKENNNSKLINTLINPHSTYRFNFTKKRDFIMGNIKNLEKERQHGSISIDMIKSNCKKIHYEKLKPVDIQSVEEVKDYAIIKQNKIKSKINQSKNANIDQKITNINKFKKSISKKNDAKISLNEKFPSIYKNILKSNKENENITRKKVTIIYRNSVKKIHPENESKENSTQTKKRIRKERPVNKSLDIHIPFVNKFLF